MMELRFPGGVAVEAHFEEHVVRTDQPQAAGGEGSAPAPFDLFLASLATCAGYFALAFCRSREIETEGLKATLEVVRHPESRRLETIRIHLTLPESFPEKYRAAILRAMDQCSVKRTILDPPEIEVQVSGGAN